MRLVLERGFFPAGDGHELYYEIIGRPRGRACIFLHGGPGGSFSTKHRKVFDPRRDLVLFFDQRGCGRSKCTDPLRANTTPHLVRDIAALQAHAAKRYSQFKRAVVVGTSWGSALALCYAVCHPRSVRALALSGVFLATEAEERYLREGATARFIPEVWEYIRRILPLGMSLRNFCARGIRSKSKASARLAARLFGLTENPLLTIESDAQAALREKYDPAHSQIALHFMAHKYFLPAKFIMRRISAIRRTPCLIVQGRQDMICPPCTAYAVHRKLLRSRLIFVTGGHTLSSKREVFRRELGRFLKECSR